MSCDHAGLPGSPAPWGPTSAVASIGLRIRNSRLLPLPTPHSTPPPWKWDATVKSPDRLFGPCQLPGTKTDRLQANHSRCQTLVTVAGYPNHEKYGRYIKLQVCLSLHHTSRVLSFAFCVTPCHLENHGGYEHQPFDGCYCPQRCPHHRRRL